MINDNGFDRAQKEYDNQLPDDNDICARCECSSKELTEVKIGKKYQYVYDSCCIHLMEHGFLKREG